MAGFAFVAGLACLLTGEVLEQKRAWKIKNYDFERGLLTEHEKELKKIPLTDAEKEVYDYLDKVKNDHDVDNFDRVNSAGENTYLIKPADMMRFQSILAHRKGIEKYVPYLDYSWYKHEFEYRGIPYNDYWLKHHTNFFELRKDYMTCKDEAWNM